MLTELGTDGVQMWASQVVEGWNWMKRPFDGVFLFLFKYILLHLPFQSWSFALLPNTYSMFIQRNIY